MPYVALLIMTVLCPSLAVAGEHSAVSLRVESVEYVDDGAGGHLVAQARVVNRGGALHQWSGTLVWLHDYDGFCRQDVVYGSWLPGRSSTQVTLWLHDPQDCEAGSVAASLPSIDDLVPLVDTGQLWLVLVDVWVDVDTAGSHEWRGAEWVLTPSIIEALLGSRTDIKQCLRDHSEPWLQLDFGKVWLVATVYPDGTLGHVYLDENLLHFTDLEVCIQTVLEDVQFPPFEGTPKVIKYPFHMR